MATRRRRVITKKQRTAVVDPLDALATVAHQSKELEFDFEDDDSQDEDYSEMKGAGAAARPRGRVTRATAKHMPKPILLPSRAKPASFKAGRLIVRTTGTKKTKKATRKTVAAAAAPKKTKKVTTKKAVAKRARSPAGLVAVKAAAAASAPDAETAAKQVKATKLRMSMMVASAMPRTSAMSMQNHATGTFHVSQVVGGPTTFTSLFGDHMLAVGPREKTGFDMYKQSKSKDQEKEKEKAKVSPTELREAWAKLDDAEQEAFEAKAKTLNKLQAKELADQTTAGSIVLKASMTAKQFEAAMEFLPRMMPKPYSYLTLSGKRMVQNVIQDRVFAQYNGTTRTIRIRVPWQTTILSSDDA